MAHVTTNKYGPTSAQIGGGLCTFTVNVDAGTGTNRAILLTIMRRGDRAPVINSITIGGESVTVLGSDATNPVTTSRVFRAAVLLDPTVTGTQSLVITCTTNGSNADCTIIVAVYDDVDPTATPSDLLTTSATDSETTPWTGTVNLSIPSATGETAVFSVVTMSSDVGYTMTPSGITSRINSVSSGLGWFSGDAAGSTTVSVSWTYSLLGNDCGAGLFGWSLPPPSTGVTLSVADCAHNHGVDNVALSQANTLAVADTVHAHAVDNVALIQAHVLAVQEVLHGHSVDNVALTQANTLAVADAVHAHAVDNVALVQAHILAVADALHAQAVDAVTLSTALTISVDDAAHAHAVDSIALTQANVLVVQEAAHGHTVESITLTQDTLLAVADALHAHAVDAVSLTQAHVLTVADATHAHSVDSPELTQANILIVSDTLHAHLVDAIGLNVGAHEIAGTIFVVEARHRIYVVAARTRSHTVH